MKIVKKQIREEIRRLAHTQVWEQVINNIQVQVCDQIYRQVLNQINMQVQNKFNEINT